MAAHFPSYLKAGTMSDKRIYPVLSPVRHSGTLYKPDDADHNKIELTKDEAKPLLKLKVIGEPAGEDLEGTSQEPEMDGAETQTPDLPTGSDDAVSLSEEERKAVIRNVLPQLKADEDLTKAGEPKVRSIEKLVGFDVSAEEVKAVWADVQAANEAATGE